MAELILVWKRSAYCSFIVSICWHNRAQLIPILRRPISAFIKIDALPPLGTGPVDLSFPSRDLWCHRQDKRELLQWCPRFLLERTAQTSSETRYYSRAFWSKPMFESCSILYLMEIGSNVDDRRFQVNLFAIKKFLLEFELLDFLQNEQVHQSEGKKWR